MEPSLPMSLKKHKQAIYPTTLEGKTPFFGIGLIISHQAINI